ncbi:hypothetical protein [Paenibacillus massiliensis]|uniref:hypothetical protein n=1 Tax=Paenibacillus massiliensis TaxID=225917 RepID=UPI00036A9562|nr:hypothetical protein [Paenibacillus massiliensis]
MQGMHSLSDKIHSWCQELLLRGLSQLTLDDLALLEQRSAEAARLNLLFLQQLLEQVIYTGRAAVLGGDAGPQLLEAYCTLSQYVSLIVQEPEALHALAE